MKILLRDVVISVSGFVGVESFEWFKNISEILKFSGQSVIGTLTIVYIVLKIKKLINEKTDNIT